MKYLGLSIDPGKMNGLCIFTWGDDEPFAVEAVFQHGGGAMGLKNLLEGNVFYYSGETPRGGPFHRMMFKERRLDALIFEKFTPRPISEDSGFHLTRDSAEPLVCEGALIGLGLDDYGAIQWAEPSQQYFIGPPTQTLAQKKKAARKFLESHGLLVTGGMVKQEDGNDANSATLHAIAWLRRRRHLPTIDALFPGQEVGPQ